MVERVVVLRWVFSRFRDSSCVVAVVCLSVTVERSLLSGFLLKKLCVNADTAV